MKFITYILLFISSLTLGQETFIMEFKQVPDSLNSGEMFTIGLDFQHNQAGTSSFGVRVSCTPQTELITPVAAWEQAAGQKKTLLMKFRVKNQANPGPQMVMVECLSQGKVVAQKRMSFQVAELRSFTLSPAGNNGFVFPGDSAEVFFQLSNTGNVPQTFSLKSNGLVQEEIQLEAGENVWVPVKKIIPKQWNRGPQTSLQLEVNNGLTSTQSRSTVPVYASSNQGEDPYNRLPSSFSLYYNHYKNGIGEQQNLSAELKGNGQWGDEKKHRIQYLFRVPNHNNRSRFGLNDQYTVIYQYKQMWKVALGDQSPAMSRLSFGGRNGMGAFVQRQSKRLGLEVFYIQPRLDQFFTAPVAGGGLKYQVSIPVEVAVNHYVSRAILPSLELTNSPVNISTMSMTFNNSNLMLRAELGRSASDYGVDYAGQFSGNFRKGPWSWSGSGILSGPQYLGVINNSTQVNNTLSFQNNRWTIGASQSFSELNETIDTLFQGVQPFFENYAVFANRRLKGGSQFRLRSFYTEREDRQDIDPLFHYLERGLDYRFLLKGQIYALNFTGRVAETENLLVEGPQRARATVGHHVSGNVFLGNHLNVMGHVNHNFTNRYSREGNNVHYINYGFGLQLIRIYNHSLGFNYNSGFSPEERYRQRDFISAVLQLNPSMKHRLSARLNWFAYPNRDDQREWFGNVKYSYQFGIPVEKKFEPFQLSGRVIMNGKAVSGVQLFCQGIQVQSQGDGSFSFKNLSEAEVMLVVNKSSLPLGYIVDYSQPLKITMNKGKVGNFIEINLVQQAVINGRLALPATVKNVSLKGCIVKLFNQEDEFYAQSNAQGEFRVDGMRPGTYNYEVVYAPDNNGEYSWKLNQGELVLQGGEEKGLNLLLQEKNKNIRFDGNSLKLN